MKKVLLVLLLALSLPVLAAADSITITDGYIQDGRMAPGEPILRFWQLHSPDGFAGATFINTYPAGPFEPGQSVETSRIFGDFQKGFVVLNGVEYTRIGGVDDASMNLLFYLSGPSVTAPPLVGDWALLSAPFTMQGIVSPPDGPPVNLDGSGTALVYFARYGDNPYWEVDGYRWEFAQPAPVPEPASLILVGSGLVGLAGWAKRRRRNRPM